MLSKIKRISSKDFFVNYLLIILSIEIALLLYVNLDWNTSNFVIINRLLVAATGIFSAILISTLLNGLSRQFENFEKAKEEIKPLTKDLTKFRKILFYLLNSHKIWQDDKYLKEIWDNYPRIDANVSKKSFEEGTGHYQIANKERFRYKKTRLYLAILTITDVERGKELELIERHKQKYTIDRVRYIHESFNKIWYYLAHKAADIEINYSVVNQTFKEDFEKCLNHFVEEEDIENFDKKMLWDISNQFYHQKIPRLINLMHKIVKGIPSLYKYLFYDLLLIVLFGLIIPLLNLSSAFNNSFFLTKTSVIITLLTVSYIIFHLKDFIFKRTRSFVNEFKI